MTKSRSKTSFAIDYEGEIYQGAYATDRDLIYVYYDGREKCTQLGGHQGYPEGLAKMLLREMVSGMPD